MVNFEKVKVIRKDKDGLKLELDNPSVIDIPVSKTYVNSVMQTFSKYCQTKRYELIDFLLSVLFIRMKCYF